MISDTPVIVKANPEYFMEISGIEKFDEGSGYRSRLSVSTGRFACSDHPFYFDNLKGFAKNLTHAYDKVEGKVRLGHIYEKDFVEISVLSNGHVTVAGFIVQHGPPHQEMRFAFECDQTYLPEMLAALKQVNKSLE